MLEKSQSNEIGNGINQKRVAQRASSVSNRLFRGKNKNDNESSYAESEED